MAEHHFGETRNNYLENLKKFHAHLRSFQNKNNEQKHTKLLQNIPSSDLMHLSVTYGNLLENNSSIYNDEDDVSSSIETSRFLLKFLRGGNHDIECATKLLIAYLQMMKDHPRYYGGFTTQGKYLSVLLLFIS